MLMFDGALGLALLALWIYCVIDAITTPAEAVRNLPKAIWVLIVILLVVPGSIIWIVAGRPWGPKRPGSPTQPLAGARPTRTVPRSKPTNPDDDPEFLASLQARADEQRRRAREQQAQARDDEPGEPVS